MPSQAVEVEVVVTAVVVVAIVLVLLVQQEKVALVLLVPDLLIKEVSVLLRLRGLLQPLPQLPVVVTRVAMLARVAITAVGVWAMDIATVS
jgi:hypothetical protein